MKKHKRRIENLERAMKETIRVIVRRDTEPEKVLVMRRNEPPHKTYTRLQLESAQAFLKRSGCNLPLTLTAHIQWKPIGNTRPRPTTTS